MKLPWLEFEKRTRLLASEEIAKSPTLTEEYRRHRKKRSLSGNPWARNLFLVYVLLMFGGLLSRYGGVELGLAVITLWATGTAFYYGQNWFQQFYASQELAVLSLLPISDEQIFHLQWRKYLRNSFWLVLGYGALYLVLWAVISKPLLSLSVVVAIAIGQAAMVFALGLNLAAWLSFIPLGAIAGLLRTSAILLLFLSPMLPAQSDYLYKSIYSISPNGWLNFVLLEHATSKDLTVLLLLIPVAIVFCGSVYAWHRLRGYYSLEGIEFHTSQGAIQNTELMESDFVRHGPTEIEDTIREGHFLKPIPWESLPFLERNFARFLSQRERTVIEFLVAGIPNWSHQVKWLFTVFFLSTVAVWLFGKMGRFAIFLPGYLLLSMVLPLSGSSWRGFAKVPTGGAFIPAYSTMPVTFGEMTGILFKYNICRLLLASPLLVAFTIFCGWRMDFSLWDSWVAAAKIMALLIAVQPLLLVFPISKATDATGRMKGLWFFVFLPLIMAIAGFAVVVFELDNPLWIAICWGMTLAGSVVFLLTFRWAYRSGRFDLLTYSAGRTGE